MSEKLKIKLCPICHIPGSDYGGGSPPRGEVCHQKSAAKSKRFFVRCTWCQLQTSGKPTETDATTAWNHRRGDVALAEERKNLIRAAKITLKALDYRDDEVVDFPHVITPFEWLR